MSATQHWCVQLYKIVFLVVSTRRLQSMPSIIATNLESVVILSSSFRWHSIHILDSKVQSLCLFVLRAVNGAIESKEAIDPFNPIRTTLPGLDWIQNE